jgi:DUF1009 family protein
VQIFSRAVPDARMLKLLWKLPRRNTDSLIGAIANELRSEGIELIDSTHFMQDHLAEVGTLTDRQPDERERGDIEYALGIAKEIATLDLGQTIVVRSKACVAIEAMEGTDATIRRAGELTRVGPEAPALHDAAESTTASRPSGIGRGLANLLRGKRANLAGGRLTVVKLAKPDQDMRFDVPVTGLPTIETMIAAGATCLCISAGKTLMFDRAEMLSLANQNGIAIVAL